jgi:hypothetical protein
VATPHVNMILKSFLILSGIRKMNEDRNFFCGDPLNRPANRRQGTSYECLRRGFGAALHSNKCRGKDDQKDVKDVKDDQKDVKDVKDMKDVKNDVNDVKDSKDDVKDVKDVKEDEKSDERTERIKKFLRGREYVEKKKEEEDEIIFIPKPVFNNEAKTPRPVLKDVKDEEKTSSLFEKTPRIVKENYHSIYRGKKEEKGEKGEENVSSLSQGVKIVLKVFFITLISLPILYDLYHILSSMEIGKFLIFLIILLTYIVIVNIYFYLFTI